MSREYSIDDERAVEMAEIYRMPFGRCKGKAMKDLRNGYLRWLAENVSDDIICGFADLLLRYRERWGIEI